MFPDDSSVPGAGADPILGATSQPHVVDIVVVPRDRFSMFRPCLAALYAHTPSPFNVFVVAGAMDRSTGSFLRELQNEKQNLKLVTVDHLLLQGEARALGLEAATGRYCVVLENDTLVHEHWLEPLLACLHEEKLAAVAPLIYWYRGLHAAGCVFDESKAGVDVLFHHQILYGDVRRRRIDYPECHCILIDRRRLPGTDIFDDVEPFDVDFGMMLRSRGQACFLEPLSVVTYLAPPPWRVFDVPAFRFRWDPRSWEARNRRFMEKWGVVYDSTRKLRSYRRQQWKLGPAKWFPTGATVGLANFAVGSLNRLVATVERRRRHGQSPPPEPD